MLLTRLALLTRCKLKMLLACCGQGKACIIETYPIAGAMSDCNVCIFRQPDEAQNSLTETARWHQVVLWSKTESSLPVDTRILASANERAESNSTYPYCGHKAMNESNSVHREQLVRWLWSYTSMMQLLRQSSPISDDCSKTLSSADWCFPF